MKKILFRQDQRSKILLCLVLLLLFTFKAGELFTLNGSNVDLYWISYQGSPRRSCCPITLMQVDQFGNIVRPPKPVIRQSKLGRGQITGTALGHDGSNKIQIWAVHQGTFQGGDILRATINKTTLVLISLKRTSVKTTNEDRIHVTQRSENNFLMIVTTGEDGDVLTGLSDNGKFDGTRWNLSPTLAGEG